MGIALGEARSGAELKVTTRSTPLCEPRCYMEGWMRRPYIPCFWRDVKAVVCQ